MKNEFKKELIESYLKETKFCKLCNISICTLEKIMNNKNYRIAALFKLAKVVKIQVYQMFGED